MNPPLIAHGSNIDDFAMMVGATVIVFLLLRSAEKRARLRAEENPKPDAGSDSDEAPPTQG